MSEPLGSVAIGGDDHRRSPRALEEQLVDVLALFLAHGSEREIVQDEQVDGGERDHDGVTRVVEAGLVKALERLVGACEGDVVAVAAGDVSEGAGDEGLADADGVRGRTRACGSRGSAGSPAH
jgi:hypothetical protein